MDRKRIGTELVVRLLLLFSSIHSLNAATGAEPNDDMAVPKEYLIEIAVKFSNGGKVRLQNAGERPQGTATSPAYFDIEEALKEANGIDGIKFVGTKKIDGTANWATGVRKGGLIHVANSAKSMLIGGDGKRKRVQFPLAIPADGNVHIFDLIQRLGQIDPQWHIRESERGACQKPGRHFCLARQHGHAMVVLSERVVPENGEQNSGGAEDEPPPQWKEAARFHFDTTGLNLYNKWEPDVERDGQQGVNYIIKEENMAGERDEIRQPNRGVYKKVGFPASAGPAMLTRPLTIEQLKEIGLDVIAKRPYSAIGPNCGHFAYQFIQSIVPEGRLKSLETYRNWPETMRLLDELSGKNAAFKQSVPFSFEKWLKETQQKRDGEDDKKPAKILPSRLK